MATQPSVAVMDERHSLTFSDAVHGCGRVCVRAYVSAWTSSSNAVCVCHRLACVLTSVRGHLASVFTSVCDRLACVLTSVRGRLACMDVSRACMHVFMRTCRLFFARALSTFGLFRAATLIKHVLIITAINIHILMSLINGNSIAMLVY